MIQHMDMPLFPLHVVLFPGSAMPLHVFEPRYRALMDRVLSEDRRFGVLAIRRGREVGGYADTFRIGTVAVVEQVQRAPDSSMAIIVTGHDRFALAQDAQELDGIVEMEPAAGAVRPLRPHEAGARQHP